MKLSSLSLVFNVLAFASIMYGQDKPKAILFDEFGMVSRAEMKSRVEKFDQRLRKNAWSDDFVNGAVLFYMPNAKTLKREQDIVIPLLSDNCRDCRGWNSRLTFVNAGQRRTRKIQLWIVPQGADLPEPEK